VWAELKDLHAGLLVTVERRHRAGARAEAEVVAGWVGEPGAHLVEVHPDARCAYQRRGERLGDDQLEGGIRPTMGVGCEVPDVLGAPNGATAGGRINNGAGQVTLNTQGGGVFPQHAAASGLEDIDGFGGLWSVTAFAVCANLNNLLDIQLVSAQTVTDTTARKIFSIDCPAGMNVTGGAAFADFPGVVEVVSPNTTRVQVIARQDGTVTPADRWSETGYAFCAS